jgi:hypothetical protein
VRTTEWIFVFLFIASGLYCLAIVAGFITFQLPLPDWLQTFGSYIRPYQWLLIVVGILLSVWFVLDQKKKGRED